jgi:hypothetical protein
MACCVLKQPLTIFGLPSTDPVVLSSFHSYLAQVADALVNCSWDRSVLEMLDLLPQVFLHLADRRELPLESLPVLCRHMHMVMKAYEREANPQLEELLMLSPEYTYHFLTSMRRQPGRRCAHPIGSYKRALLPDPHWAMQWYRVQSDNAYYREILEFIRKTKDASARSAWAWHRMNVKQMSRSAAVADISRLLPLILLDPQLSFWVMDNYPEVDRRTLFRSAIRYPAFLLAWAKRFPGEFDTIIQRELVRHPAWLVQYIHEFKPADARSLWKQSRQRCCNDWLLPWLDHYARRVGWL